MGLWIYYFLAKLYLFARGYISFGVWLNLLLVVFVTFPKWPYWSSQPAALKKHWLVLLHRCVAVILAVLLLWHDSYLRSLAALIAFLNESSSRPSLSYILTFVSGYWDTREALVLLLLFLGCWWAIHKKIKLTALVVVLIFVPGIQGLVARAPSINEEEAKFFANQSQESQIIHFSSADPAARPFDIVVLHVCSLAWDDLVHSHMNDDPFFSEFDLLLTHFNTVTSYSTPSALRLLRAPCGQARHHDLYQPTSTASDECFLMEALRKVQYVTQSVTNNRGKMADSMADQIERLAKASPRLELPGLAVEATNFDSSQISNNFETLEAWWKQRQNLKADRVALYYNTVTLHGGAHLVSDKNWWNRSRPEKYREFLKLLFTDFSKFFALLKNSGRDVLIVFVPEHGAALVGSKIQAQDLRDIPLTPITTVPVGFKFISRDAASPTSTLKVDKPSSYRAIAYIMSALLKQKSAAIRDLAGQIPETPLYSENENEDVMVVNQTLYYRQKGSAWTRLSEDQYSTGKP